MSLRNSFTTVLYLALSVALLFVSGYGVTRLCLGDEDENLRWVVTPVAGLAVWILLIENLGILGLGTKKGAPLALLVVIAFAIGVYLGTKHRASRPGESTWQVWVLCCLCLAVVIWPMLLLSHKDYVGFANPDAWILFSRAAYFQQYDYWEFPFSSTDISYHPMLGVVKILQAIHHRAGESYWVSSVASLLHSDPKEVYQIVNSTAYLLICLSVFAMCRFGFGLKTQQALLATLLVGVNAVLALIYYQQLLPHIMGSAILPLILGMGAYLIRAPCLGPAILLALLLSALFCIYPELFPFAVIPLGTYLISTWRELDRRKILRLASFVVLITIVLNPIYWLHGLDFLLKEFLSTAGGRTYFYVFSPIMFPIYFGLTSSPFMYTDLLPSRLLMAQLVLIFPLAVALLGIIVFGIQRLYRLREKACLAYLIAYASMGLGLLLLKGRYTYGFFKFLSYTQFLVLTALAVGLVELWHMGGTDPLRRVCRRLAETVGLLYLGLNLVNVASFGFISSQQEASFGLRNATKLPGSQAYHGLREILPLVGPDESVMVDVASLVQQLYLTYYLRDIRISIPQPSFYLAQPYREALPLHHSFKDNYLLQIHDASRDIVVNQTSEPLWKNETFALSRFPELYVTLVTPNPSADGETNWYPVEYDWRAREPFRWVNNDAMVRVIGAAGLRLILVAELAPPPWDPSPNRRIDLYVNNELRQTVNIVGRTRLFSLPFVLPSGNTLVRLHAREEAKARPIENRVLAFLLGDTRNIGELNFRVYSIGARSVPSPAEVLRDRIEFSPSFITTNWQGQAIVEGVEPDLWVLDRLSVRLWREEKSDLLVLRGSFPQAMSLITALNGREVGVVRVARPGEQDVRIPFPIGASRPGLHDITIRGDTFMVPRDRGINQDPRRLSFRVHSLYLQ